MIEMNVEEFVRRFKSCVKKNKDSKFLFFIGAGCSISSGIPSAGELVKMWLPKLKKFKIGDDKNEEDWAKEYFEGYDGTNASLYYGRVIEELFTTAQERQKEIERLIEGKDPGFGYAVLAQLMAHKDYGGNFNALLTTNFDDLVADALYLFTQQKPLVITHEALAGFVRVTRFRPLVIKLHGDARLEPKNTETETEELAERLKKVLNNLLGEMGIIFMGYGGNDKSIAEILGQLPANAMPWGIYWIGDTIPEGVMGEWLEKRKAFHVKHRDFDELMLLLWKEFELKHPDEKWFKNLIDNYRESFKNLKDKVEKKEPEAPEKKSLEEAVEKAVKEFPDWWAAVDEASKYEDKNPEKALKIYKDSYDRFNNEFEYLLSYTYFLQFTYGDYRLAAEIYERLLKIAPNSAWALSNYAVFLESIVNDYDSSMKYFERALTIEPNDPIILSNYLLLLNITRSDKGKIKKYIERLNDIETQDPVALANYAIVHQVIMKDFEKAEEYFKRALEISPEYKLGLLAYSNFLWRNKKDFDEAEKYYLKLRVLYPKDPAVLARYSLFLCGARKDYDKAEEFYKEAVNSPPRNAKVLGTYAIFLHTIRKDYIYADEIYKDALMVDPNNSINICNYAGFLLGRGLYDLGMEQLGILKKMKIIDIIKLESAFYNYAHHKDNSIKLNSLKKIKKFLLYDIRSFDFDLRLNIERATKDGHTALKFLEILAKVICDEIGIEELEEFEEWKNIKI